jgi:hypothetical protein
VKGVDHFTNHLVHAQHFGVPGYACGSNSNGSSSNGRSCSSIVPPVLVKAERKLDLLADRSVQEIDRQIGQIKVMARPSRRYYRINAGLAQQSTVSIRILQ